MLEDLLAEGERLRFALEAGRMGTWTWSPESGEVTWDEAMEALYGLAPGEFTGTVDDFFDRLHPEDRAWVVEEVAAAWNDGRDISFEHRVLWPDGSVHWLEGRGRVVQTNDVPTGVIGVGIDIDERKRLELAVSDAISQRATAELARELEQQRHAVQVLNEVLIRPDFPSVPGIEMSARYLAADDAAGIGGDWYDSFLVPDGRLLVAVGDVTGHGIPAARLMAKLRHATRAYAVRSLPPDEVLAALDDFVNHFSRDEQLATVQLALVDHATGMVEIASAGHPPALVIDHDNHRFADVEGGCLLGLGASVVAGVDRFQLEPGAALVLYTDGLVERRGESIELGLERLLRAAKAVDLHDGAAAARDVVLDQCLHGTTPRDDVCILVVVRAD